MYLHCNGCGKVQLFYLAEEKEKDGYFYYRYRCMYHNISRYFKQNPRQVGMIEVEYEEWR